MNDRSQRIYSSLIAAMLFSVTLMAATNAFAEKNFVILFSTSKSEADAIAVAQSVSVETRQPAVAFGNYVVSPPYQTEEVARLRLVPGATLVGVSAEDADMIRRKLDKERAQAVAPRENRAVATKTQELSDLSQKKPERAIGAKLECDKESLYLPAIFYIGDAAVTRCVQVDKAFFRQVQQGVK